MLPLRLILFSNLYLPINHSICTYC